MQQGKTSAETTVSFERVWAIMQENERENLMRLQHFCRAGDHIMTRIPARKQENGPCVSKDPFVIKAVYDNGNVMLDTGTTISDKFFRGEPKLLIPAMSNAL
ncbi:hypothetical protein PHMEG_00014066 [Phytophthora megakarya]|uniref:Uncharacterized protein n=1 Tax=Phytophthora megakarya TaxID=4795 RepID=A0A225W4Q2_9STRA|nr:hypothetical protein PHMEG_00014066 [Phytophthora megakarya]